MTPDHRPTEAWFGLACVRGGHSSGFAPNHCKINMISTPSISIMLPATNGEQIIVRVIRVVAAPRRRRRLARHCTRVVPARIVLNIVAESTGTVDIT